MTDMLKKWCLLFAILCLLTQCVLFNASAQSVKDPMLQAAFENNALALREVPSITDYSGYTLRASSNAYAQKAEMDGTVTAIPADGAWVSLDLDGRNFHPAPYFYSPDGSKAILMDEEHAYVLKDNTITMILPNYLRSVRDSYGGFSRFIKMQPTQ
jgi:hypothetical protein